MSHIDHDDLVWTADGRGGATATTQLSAGQTAWNPASTKRVLHGPASVTYVRYADGGIDAIEREAAA